MADPSFSATEPQAEFFYERLAKQALVVQKCRNCGMVQFYPRYICRHCQHSDLYWIEVPPQGDIYSFSIVYRVPSGFDGRVPFTTAVVELAEGPRLFTRLVNIAPEAVRIGMAVRASWQAMSKEPRLLIFEPGTASL